jgi:hypothetical protein
VKAVVGETMKRLSRLPLNLFTEQTPCIPEMLRGTYAFHYEGTMFTIPQGATAPVAVPSCSVGVSWIDTSNRMPGLATANVGGVSREGGWTTPPYPGTIESNCMGTMAWSTAVEGAPAGEGEDRFVLVDGGREIWSITVKSPMGKVTNLGIFKQISPLPVH